MDFRPDSVRWTPAQVTSMLARLDLTNARTSRAKFGRASAPLRATITAHTHARAYDAWSGARTRRIWSDPSLCGTRKGAARACGRAAFDAAARSRRVWCATLHKQYSKDVRIRDGGDMRQRRQRACAKGFCGAEVAGRGISEARRGKSCIFTANGACADQLKLANRGGWAHLEKAYGGSAYVALSAGKTAHLSSSARHACKDAVEMGLGLSAPNDVPHLARRLCI
ncbi:hypothetical protein B0H17DRAFT_1135504 [Mycena rosella]|uniref:Uncharacterized protein n=1 Tax=Mycena rosella TaxID=1033263 RepID=A0AAD7DG60_MYCRO|nr:hypothetical protein B0H17DRAFT_1135504 [Mycena rosella]